MNKKMIDLESTNYATLWSVPPAPCKHYVLAWLT